MVASKSKFLALCKQVASEHPGWQFTAGKFVNKISKDLHFNIEPDLIFKGDVIRLGQIDGIVMLPTISKMIASIDHMKAYYPSKRWLPPTIKENLLEVRANSPLGRIYLFAGNNKASEEQLHNEVDYWLNECQAYLLNKWPTTNFTDLFAVMKTEDNCYNGRGRYGLLCLAASLGEFEFIDYFYSHEMPKVHANAAVSLRYGKSDDNLLAALPDWKAQWQATGTINV